MLTYKGNVPDIHNINSESVECWSRDQGHEYPLSPCSSASPSPLPLPSPLPHHSPSTSLSLPSLPHSSLMVHQGRRRTSPAGSAHQAVLRPGTATVQRMFGSHGALNGTCDLVFDLFQYVPPRHLSA